MLRGEKVGDGLNYVRYTGREDFERRR